MSKTLSRDDILAADDLPRESVEVPEWGGAVHLRSMTGTERDAFEVGLMGKTGTNMENIRSRLITLTAVDEKGERLFPEEGDVILLGKKSAAALDRLFAVAQRLNGLSARDVEVLEKN